jgi:hypothetical protein
MWLQKLEKAGKWLFGFTVAGGIVLSASSIIEFLPVIIGVVFLAALPGFPDFRRQFHWRRMLLFSGIAMLALQGMYYWAILDYNTGDLSAGVCLWAVWPLVDYDTNSGVPWAYWIPFWLMKGLLFGFIIESFSVLNKQRGVKRIAACVRRDSEAEGDVPPFGLAAALCMACLAAIFWVLHSLASSSPRLIEWLLPVLFIGPPAAAFIILYRSSWQCEVPATQRVVAIMLRSSVIFGVVLLVILLMLMAMGFVASIEVPRGQYGGL